MRGGLAVEGLNQPHLTEVCVSCWWWCDGVAERWFCHERTDQAHVTGVFLAGGGGMVLQGGGVAMRGLIRRMLPLVRQIITDLPSLGNQCEGACVCACVCEGLKSGLVGRSVGGGQASHHCSLRALKPHSIGCSITFLKSVLSASVRA